MKTISETLLDILPLGEVNAIRKADLCQRLDISERDLRSMIHELRASGLPVLSSVSHAGYFLPSAQKDTAARECMAFVRSQRSRALECFRSVRGAKMYIRAAEGQIAIDERGGQV